MNEYIFRYKTRGLTLILLLSYAYMHMRLTGFYVDASLEQLIDFNARLPFAQRLLVPSMAHVLGLFLPFNIASIFFLLEWFFISMTWFSMRSLLRFELSTRQSVFLSWLFILLLPLMSIVNYRFTIGMSSTFFYPCDTAMLFFMSLGFLLCLQQRWTSFVLLVFLATFNRESSLLLALLIPVLHWQSFSKKLKPFFMALSAYGLARVMVVFLVSGLKGGLVEFYFRQSSHSYFEVNMYWLLGMENFLLFAFCFAGLPLFWFVFYDYIPQRYRPIRYLALFYFLGLALVGNFMEVRIFGELLVLLYLPVCLALSRWLSGQPAYPVVSGTVLSVLNRYAVLGLLTALVVFCVPLNQLLIYLLHGA